MSFGRAVSAVTSCVAVVGCAAFVIAMASATSKPTADHSTPAPGPSRTDRPAFLPDAATPTSAAAAPASSSSSTRASAPSSTMVPAPATSAPPPASHVVVAAPAHTTAPAAAAPKPKQKPRPAPTTAHRAPAPAPAPGQALPLGYSTGSATRVITVTARSHSSATAKLQAWTKVSTGRWKKYGSSVTAHVGADGIGSASETRSATPAGTFTLTQAFGHNSDPGTNLPYVRTNSSDYWISTAGSKYNTHQRCSSCNYDNGVNERLYYETPYYNYAVVIDYNTRNAPGGVHAGKGSAFFLHVTDGASTAGCVAISQSKLTSLMRWLTPSAHPRILIGVT